ncbi:hypothetical protein YTPLAS18_15150 [Nitrospira sp.]|nr:hypothetical protein YTPLAS18_15150 [Nitrospira sp.]
MDTSTNSLSVESESSPERILSSPSRADHVKSGPSVEVQAPELAEFVRWHAGWDLIEIKPWPDSCSNMPLLLHDVIWDTSQRALVVQTFQGACSDSMVRLGFRVEDVMTVRVGSAYARPERCLYVRTRQGRLVTLRVRFSLTRKADYHAAWRRLETIVDETVNDGAEIGSPVAESRDLPPVIGTSADCTLGSAQSAVS